MNILLIAKGYPPDVGGLETYSEQVAQAYVRAGHNVTVVTAHNGQVYEEVREGVCVFNVGQASQLKVFIRMLRVLLRLRRKPSFDFVHATTWRVAMPAIVLLSNVRLLISVHGREVFVVPVLMRPIMRKVFLCADSVVAVSQPILDAFTDSLPYKLKQSKVAWNGVSFKQAKGEVVKNSDPTHVFCMCRLVARKNLVSAVKAMAILYREGINFTFNIAGSGPETQAIKEAISNERVESRVKYLGRISDADAISEYSRAGIFLHPQITTEGGADLEGFGIVVADAMIFGAVAVVGNVGGPTDFIRNKETGMIVDGSSPINIANAVRVLLLDVKLQKRIAEEGLRFANAELTWDKHVGKTLAFLLG